MALWGSRVRFSPTPERIWPGRVMVTVAVMVILNGISLKTAVFHAHTGTDVACVRATMARAFVNRQSLLDLCSRCRYSRFNSGPRLTDAIAIFLLAKQQANKRPLYIVSLRQYLTAFALFFGNKSISAFAPQCIDTWFRCRTEAASTRASNIGRLSALFSYAVRQDWIGANPVAKVERVTVDRKSPQILSPDQTSQMLTAARTATPELIPAIILQVFMGVRPAEVQRLRWSAIREKVVVIGSDVSKVRLRRTVPISDTARTWLASCIQEPPPSPVAPLSFRRRMGRLKKRLPFGWTQDLLRHTAASYLLAKEQDAAKVALWLGNSPKILLNHYHATVSDDEMRRFWELRPSP